MGDRYEYLIENKEWLSIRKECRLARELLGSGINSLRSANYADGEGHYYNAFFGLSIGLERLAKLIIVADYIVRNKGAPPDKKFIKSMAECYQHKLTPLLSKINDISIEHDLELTCPCLGNNISIKIISCLHSFATAGEGRYFNFSSLFNPNFKPNLEPINKWWQDVAEFIVAEHYYDGEIKMSDNTKNVLELMKKDHSLFYTNEVGKIMRDRNEISEWDIRTQIVQQFGCFHTLTIVRWMACVFIELSKKNNIEQKNNILFEHSKYFIGFIQSDEHLKITKHWPVEIQH